MASGTVIIRSVDEAPQLQALLYFFHHIKRIFIRIGMGNADDLIFRIYDVITD